MSLSNKTVLVTGANRGIGEAVVRELLNAGVKKIYAGARNIQSLPNFADSRVVPLQLDVTNDNSVKTAAEAAKDVDVLVNNAGTAVFGGWTDIDESNDGDMRTNYYGTLRVIRAFTPRFVNRGSGTIANVVSVVGLGSVPALAGYSASKAALQSLTQSLRGDLAKAGVRVIGIYPGPIDTDLAKDIPLEKATPKHAAENIVRGLEAGETYIFPDPVALQIGSFWAKDGRQVEEALLSSGE